MMKIYERRGDKTRRYRRENISISEDERKIKLDVKEKIALRFMKDTEGGEEMRLG